MNKESGMIICGSDSPYFGGEEGRLKCELEAGHKGDHYSCRRPWVASKLFGRIKGQGKGEAYWSVRKEQEGEKPGTYWFNFQYLPKIS